MQEGPSCPALANLATAHLIVLAEQVVGLQPQPSQLADAPEAWHENQASLEAGVRAWEAASVFLLIAGPWPDLDNADAVLAFATTAEKWLLRLAGRGRDSWTWLEPTASALLLVAELMLAKGSLGWASTQVKDQGHHLPQAGQEGGQQQRMQFEGEACLGVPMCCLEAVAVSISALCAALIARWEAGHFSGGEGQPEAAVPTQLGLTGLADSLTKATAVIDMLASHLAWCLDWRRKPVLIEPVLATMESSLRLVGWLVGLGPRLLPLPGAEQAGLGPTMADSTSSLLHGCSSVAAAFACCLCDTSKERQSCNCDTPEGLQSGSSCPEGDADSDSGHIAWSSAWSPEVDSSLAISLGSLAASATKALALLVTLAGSGGAVAVDADLCFLNIAVLVTEGLTRGGSSHLTLLEGSLLPLLHQLSLLYAASPGLMLDAQPRVQDTSQGSPEAPTNLRIRIIGQLLAKLDTLPGSAGLQLQERLVPVFCAMMKYLMTLALRGEEPWRGRLALRLAAEPTAAVAQRWQRSAVLAVQNGLVDEGLTWAVEASTRQTGTGQELVIVWKMCSAVIKALLRQLPEGANIQAAPVLKLIEGLEQGIQLQQSLLEVNSGGDRAAEQQQTPSSLVFWQYLAAGEILPQLEALAAAAAAQWRESGSTAQLLVARALATRACANPGCTNLRGCSEWRLRSQRCSGCRVARYCTRDCQLADFAAHGRVCQQLRGEGPAPVQQPH